MAPESCSMVAAPAVEPGTDTVAMLRLRLLRPLRGLT